MTEFIKLATPQETIQIGFTDQKVSGRAGLLTFPSFLHCVRIANPCQANSRGGRKLGLMQISKPVRQHAAPADRQRILQAYRHTPLSQREFATQVGMSVATLKLWRKQSTAPPPPERPQFVALPNLLPNPTPGPI